MGFFDSLGEFFTGKPGKFQQKLTLGKEQQPLYQQLLAASQGSGAGGAYGTAADYYRDLLSDDSQTYNDMQAPEMRQFHEQIIPDLAEQFAGMGSGGLSSSGFRNAAVNAGTDLSERLGSIRAQLRQQGAQGLTNIGQQGLNQFNENIYRPGTEGFLSSVAPGIGSAIGSFAGNWMSGKGKTSPYGEQNNQAMPNQSRFGNQLSNVNFGDRY